ncbi:hypothetical protein R1flu_026377 [Riccia fluitans]|uniref:Uncharacterized protein n=1 Tax=Riccia fluitans TaxID=41844 RepID=A0ABD1XFS6_9MARC
MGDFVERAAVGHGGRAQCPPNCPPCVEQAGERSGGAGGCPTASSRCRTSGRVPYGSAAALKCPSGHSRLREEGN